MSIEKYSLPNQDFQTEAEKLRILGTPGAEQFNVTYQIPGISYLSQPVNLNLFASPRYGDGEIKGVFLIQSEAQGGNSFDLSPLINRRATVEETLFLTRLLELKFPYADKLFKRLARENIVAVVKEAEYEMDSAKTGVTSAETELEKARQRLEDATTLLNMVKIDSDKGLIELES